MEKESVVEERKAKYFGGFSTREESIEFLQKISYYPKISKMEIILFPISLTSKIIKYVYESILVKLKSGAL